MNFENVFIHYGYLAIKSGLIFGIGFFVVKFFSSFTEKILNKYQNEYVGMIASKLIYYVGLFLIIMMALDNFGINTTQLLGAAGVVGVAVGFASQTSVSNIISGAFLLAEKPFVMGDWLKIGTTVGKVKAVDLLSIKLVTSENELVRIPNEYLVKNSFTNLTKFKLRRISVVIGVSYKQDINKILKLLIQVINENEFNKNKEKSLSVITNFGESAIEISAYMWVTSTETTKSKSSLLADIKNKFDKEQIEIPFPQVVIHQEND